MQSDVRVNNLGLNSGHRVAMIKNAFRSKGAIKHYFLFSADDKKELDDTKKRYNELSEKLMEKNRQYLKLQVNYFMCSILSHCFRNLMFITLPKEAKTPPNVF